MESQKNTDSRTEILKALIVCSSVLGIAGYFFHNTVFFLVAGIICAVLVFGLGIVALITTHKAILPLYLVYGFIFALLMVIGILVGDTLWNGVLLGLCFIGLSIAFMAWLIEWIHAYIAQNGPQWFRRGYDPFEEDDDQKLEEEEYSELTPILLDEKAPQADRIQDMSDAFERMDMAFSTLDDCLEIIRHNKETMKALERYMDSGLWKEDFEAMERGEITPDCDPFGVLSEDGLYNLLEDTKEILEEIKSLDYN